MDVYEEMANFRKLFGPNPTRSINKEYYKWKILKNPYCFGHIYLKYKEGIATGSASITPKKIAVLGKEMLAAEIGDTFTHPEYRKLGIFSQAVKNCTEYAISVNAHIIYGTPNDQSLPGYQKKLGYPPCPYAKVERLHKYFKAKPLEKDFIRKIGKKIPATVLSRIYFCYLTVLSFIRKKKVELSSLPLEITSISQFEEEIEGLWGFSRKEFVFFTIRDKEYLNWRFFLNPDRYIVLTAKIKKMILGYIAIKVSKSEDLYIGSICDFVTYQDRIDVFVHLLNEAERLFKDFRVDFIELLCSTNSPYFKPISDFGYLIKRNRPIIIYAGTDVGKLMHSTDKKWHFTLADADNI